MKYRYKIYSSAHRPYITTTTQTPAQMQSWKNAYNRHNKDKITKIEQMPIVQKRVARRSNPFSFGGF